MKFPELVSGNGMGIVWEAYHKGGSIIEGFLESPLNWGKFSAFFDGRFVDVSFSEGNLDYYDG